MRISLQNKIDYSISLIRKAEKLALQYDSENGFYLAFSGGKDSQTIYHLTEEAGVKFKAHMNLTSVDPPEVIRFVRSNYPDVELIKPRLSVYDMALKKCSVPTMMIRWCCAEYKEKGGSGKVVILGIRRQESSKRSQRNEIEASRHKFSEQFDQFSEHEEQMLSCVNGKDKIMLSPILMWSEEDVWEYLNDKGIEHCCLYDEGYKRIGCICCPMSQYKQKIKDITRYPHVRRNWEKVMAKLIEKGFYHKCSSEKELFDWWISGKSFKQFYSDEFIQQKIKF